MHADELLAEFEDFEDLVDNQNKMINELKAHADTFTVDDVKNYNERLTDFLQCPLAQSKIVLGNSCLDGNEVALILDFVGALIRNPNHVEISFG